MLNLPVFPVVSTPLALLPLTAATVLLCSHRNAQAQAQVTPVASAPSGASATDHRKDPDEVRSPWTWEPDTQRAESTPWVVDRRREQVRTEPGYIASPIAVNIPGIGFSYGVVGSVFNIQGTEMDTFLFTSNGDTNGFGLGLIDTPIFHEILTFNMFHSRFRDTGLQSHRRGIDSDPDDGRILKLRRTSVLVGQLSLRFWEKRIQLNAGTFRSNLLLDRILDQDGELIADPEDSGTRAVSYSLGTLLDFTDDRSDPRKGIQYESQYYQPQKQDDFNSQYYITDHNVNLYVPVGRISTWVFNAYRSDAVVTRAGVTDEAAVREEKGLGCQNIPDPSTRAECTREEDMTVRETIAANRYGTASGIGGTQRMRSYVTGRFRAAHAQTFGSELRLNLTEELTPFNVYVAKGIRTGIQLAAFGEWGTVADDEDDLYGSYRRSLGLGLRLIVASGFIVRLDVAQGDEGVQPTLFFNYPWFVF